MIISTFVFWDGTFRWVYNEVLHFWLYGFYQHGKEEKMWLHTSDNSSGRFVNASEGS